MPRGNGTSVGSKMIQDVKGHLNTGEMLKYGSLEKETSRMWRNFWIRAAFDHGYSVADIAKEFEVSQATVYNTLK